ncbi:AfsR/SARP family transcriptional regulator [Dactylosporangium vinaceum]|uniref:BTAD domain-containing putative transcriptional regulator n=1 Tax=Dactylosporangium vinaceum TaxID=53362 RepID=A0ABV5MFM7_9ACTN|nr:BTAD domain-containing putative transcriptional regulator [Dactylosporangium vinaceum]UAB98809.1 AfsR/SARP family transcriptional regulator [Dactylosporangium vinaceum]
MRFSILGPLEVHDDAGNAVAVAGPKPRALLVRLLLSAGRVVPFERLGGETPNALQAQVSRLRRALPGGLVEFAGAGYRIAIDPDDVDVHRFERGAADGRRLLALGECRAAASVLRAALDLWRGPALADLPEAAAQVVRLEEARLAAVEDLVEAELALPAGTAIGPLRRLVAEHPFRERLRGQLMRALHAAGRTAEALGEFDDLRRLLAAELGTDPSAALRAVHLRLLQGESAPPARRGPPAPLTRLIGRAAELQRLAALGPARLVTLVGPGGAGKTRLAVEAAGPGACFADLSAVEDAAGVPLEVAAALGLRDGGLAPAAAADPVRRLESALAGQELLLVLDNCEQALDAVAGLVRTLLGAGPGLRVLATSREPLGLTGEVLVPVGPLPPEPALALFAERAAAVRPGFTVGAGNAEAVRQVCALVDGLPLAIELAAARLRQLDIHALAARLAQHEHFAVLSRGDRTAADRHRTLHAVVDWSWRLLSDEERTAAGRLSVFAGGATGPAALAVCGAGEEVLIDLADRSLVVARDGRYRMLETILLFCRGRLGAAEQARLQQAHAAYFLRLACTADGFLRRAEQLDWLAVLAADHDNLIAAVRHADRPTAMRLITALAAYWWLSGRRREVAPLAAALLDGPVEGLEEEYVSCVVHAESMAPPAHRAHADAVVAALDRPLRHPFGAAVWGMSRAPGTGPDPSPAILAGDPWNEALQDLGLELLQVLGGHPAEARLQDVHARFLALGERWGIGQCQDWLAQVASWRGDHALAHERWAVSIGCFDELGAALEAADVLCRRGFDSIRQAALPAAEADFRRAIPTPASALGLAEVARLRGDLPLAAAELERAAAEIRPGDPASVYVRASVLTARARLAEAEHRLDDAARLHEDAWTAVQRAPLPANLADVLEGRAGHALLTGRARTAAVLLGRAVALRGTAVAGDPDVAATAAGATAALGPSAFADAYAEGLRGDAQNSV